MAKHIADGEKTFRVVNINPDFCIVDGKIVPFEIEQEMEPELQSYSPDVHARGQRVLTAYSMIEGVIGNEGEGKVSGVSLSRGHTMILEGDPRYFVNGNPVCRHGDQCTMNVKVG